MPDRDPDVRIAIYHSIKVLGLWTAILYGVVAFALVVGLAVNVHTRNNIEDIQEKTATALCTFRQDIVRRHDDTVDFLLKHPDGIEGISAADLQRSIHAQEATIKALEGLPCPSPAPLFSSSLP